MPFSESAFRSCLIFGFFVLLWATSVCRAEDKPRVDAFGDPLPAGAVARLGRTRLRMNSDVTGLRFLANDSQLATWDRQSTVAFWDVETGRLLRRVHFPVSPWFALSPDERTLAAVHDSGDILLIDAETGKIGKRLKGHRRGATYELAFSSNSQYLASCTWRFLEEDPPAEIRLWDTTKGELARLILSPEPFPLGLCFAPNGGAFYATASEKVSGPGKLLRWSVTGNEEGETVVEVSSTGRTLFTPDGRLVLVAGAGITAFDSATGVDRLAIEPGKVWDLSISTRGSVLAAASHEGPLKRWSLPSGKPLPDLPLPHDVSFLMTWSRDDRKIAYCHRNAVYLIDAETGTSLQKDEDAQTQIVQIAVSSDGRLIAATDGPADARSIRVWERGSDGRLAFCRIGEPTAVGLRFRQDESLLVATRNGRIRTWDLNAKRVTSTILETSPFDEFRTSFDGSRALLADWDWSKARLVDLTSGKEVSPLENEAHNQMILSPDGQSLISTDGRLLNERNLPGGATRALHQNEMKREDTIARISVSPDSQSIVAEVEFNTYQKERSRIFFVDRKSTEVRARIDLPREWLHATTVSPDSKLLAVGTSLREGSDYGHIVGGALYLYRMDGQFLSRVPLESVISTLAFSADGGWLVTGLRDTSILVWDVAALQAMKPE